MRVDMWARLAKVAGVRWQRFSHFCVVWCGSSLAAPPVGQRYRANAIAMPGPWHRLLLFGGVRRIVFAWRDGLLSFALASGLAIGSQLADRKLGLLWHRAQGALHVCWGGEVPGPSP